MASAGEPRKLELEVRFDREPIEGRVSEIGRDDGLNCPFSGWLGLLAAIEAARAPQAQTRQEGRR